MEEAIRLLESQLKKAGHNSTHSRKSVFVSLLNSEPLTMNQLVNSVKIDRASVYRTVSLFEELGIVKRIQLGWKYKLELSDDFLHHHHHMYCIKCGRIQSFEETPAIAFEIKQLALEAGFVETKHELEIAGVCKNCQ